MEYIFRSKLPFSETFLRKIHGRICLGTVANGRRYLSERFCWFSLIFTVDSKESVIAKLFCVYCFVIGRCFCYNMPRVDKVDSPCVNKLQQ